MEQEGYIYTEQPENPAPHMMFLKGYTPRGFVGQAFHLHVRYSGDWDELYFRDFLIDHKDAAYEYGALKRKLFEATSTTATGIRKPRHSLLRSTRRLRGKSMVTGISHKRRS